MWARSRALLSRNLVRRVTTCFAERDEQRQQVLQVHHLRPAAIERHHVGAEIGLQRREPVELVQHDVRHRVALQFDDDAKAVAVGFVAQIGDAFDLLLAVPVRRSARPWWPCSPGREFP